ncbi:ankyrin repeat protein [Colletotrichum chrysophilum]|uniref:Ankyrin repeat protein n=1 Tax=Colletotrichum chrysophilum TaxID=1836956 RepID=A0AAD9A0W3_9PEZI|nr:ankyrin repeat protein [Colletotrichum chrysophilum]
MSQLAIINMDPTQRTFAADATPTWQDHENNNTVLLSSELSTIPLSSPSPSLSTGTNKITKTYASCVDLPQELILGIIGYIAENYGTKSTLVDTNAEGHRVKKVLFEKGLQFAVWHDLVSLAASCKTLYHRITPTIYDMNVEHGFGSALVSSAKYGSSDGMMWALENGADVNQTEVAKSKDSRWMPLHHGMTALHWASYHCDLDTMRVLLDRGADPECEVDTYQPGLYGPLSSIISIFWRHLRYTGLWRDKISQLLAKGVNPLFFALIPSYKAADHLYLPEYQITRQRCRKAARTLINAGSSLITHRTLGIHALHQACGSRDVNLARHLLDHCDADADVKDCLGNSPLHYFALDGFEGYDDPEELVGLMVQHGADVNAANLAGYTPLHYALAFWDDGHHLTDKTDHMVALLKAGAYLLPECKDLRDKIINNDRYNDAQYVNRLVSKAVKLSKRHAIRFDERKLPTMEELREKEQMVALTSFYHCCEVPEEYQLFAVKEFTDELSKDEWRDYWYVEEGCYSLAPS